MLLLAKNNKLLWHATLAWRSRAVAKGGGGEGLCPSVFSSSLLLINLRKNPEKNREYLLVLVTLILLQMEFKNGGIKYWNKLIFKISQGTCPHTPPIFQSRATALHSVQQVLWNFCSYQSWFTNCDPGAKFLTECNCQLKTMAAQNWLV